LIDWWLSSITSAVFMCKGTLLDLRASTCRVIGRTGRKTSLGDSTCSVEVVSLDLTPLHTTAPHSTRGSDERRMRFDNIHIRPHKDQHNTSTPVSNMTKKYEHKSALLVPAQKRADREHTSMHSEICVFPLRITSPSL